MIKSVKTRSSTPGRASVKSAKIDRSSVLGIFDGSEEDSSENSRAFDNPQEPRGRDASNDTRVPEMPMPSPKDPPHAGSKYNSPNFSYNSNKITENPKVQMNSDFGPHLSEKAERPLQQTATREGVIPSLADPGMSRPVLEKYSPANEIATKNASFPRDFKSEMNPVRENFSAESIAALEPTKNAFYQEVNQVKFQSFDEAKKGLKQKSDSEIPGLMDPGVQPDYFTSSAKQAIPSDFFSKGELSPSNVFASHSNTTGDYGRGDMPQTREASSMLSQQSVEAGRTSSPQRAVEALSSVDGRGSMKGESISKQNVSVDRSLQDRVSQSLSSKDSMNSSRESTFSLADSGRSFFISNFSIAPSTISSVINTSSSNTSSTESQI